MLLHNTLSKQTQEFTPIDPTVVSLYTCGPTVYNYYHIGNLRNAIFNDMLKRTLIGDAYNVKHVMNITDVGHLVSDADDGEDKLEKGAKREGKTVWEVAQYYTDCFKADMAALNVLPPNGYHSKTHDDSYARATEFIPSQIEMVERLLNGKFAYITQRAIYFDVSKVADYGELSGQSLASKATAARAEVVTDTDKHSPHDFAVWFFAVGNYADHSMVWDSPWGKGFPGWHLECSAIIHATLGDPIDIHTGGVDHIGTHHPNEIAQTQGAYGHALARYWVHNEFMLVDGAKMSKSKGNSYTLKDLTDRKYHPLAYRLLVLQAHYRTEINFTWESLTAAQNTLINLYAWADLRHQANLAEVRLDDHTISELLERIQMSLNDDLATASALSEVFKIVTSLSPGMTYGNEDFDRILASLDLLLGLGLAGRPDITAEQQDLIDQREAARATKDWAAADKLRTKLARHDLEVSDTPNGPRWRRLTA